MTLLFVVSWMFCGVVAVLCANESWNRRYPSQREDWTHKAVWVMFIGGPLSLLTAWISFRVAFGDREFGRFFIQTDGRNEMTSATRSAIRKWIDEGKYLYMEPDEDDVDFEHCALDDSDTNIGALAEAIESAERERCAKIADAAICVFSGPALRSEGFDLARKSIANQIRKDRGCDPPQAETKS